MKIFVLGLSMACMSTGASDGLWVGKLPSGGWYATNQDLYCNLKRDVDAPDVKLEFLFVSGLPQANKAPVVTFRVNAIPAQLAWPIRFSVGSNPSAPHVEIAADPASPTFVTGQDVERLFGYLRSGKGLDVNYSLVDGIKRRIYLDAFNFRQSAAMFEACTAHVV